ncbi:hypothetical protein ACFPAF_18265 [Hymenobacter endophyticus]|uniref:DUF5348 domain-containing protein n=1 Tax=Hymenobacter endophyticus TaxID=3076335 RepID=A0ABU3TLT3_9BACT|nr:hypothetical protein [Hymenobacter endophyticus]MDU0372352.1 hypothetical protein [Hymenobacter endophyticus]
MSQVLEIQIMPTSGSLYQRGFDIDTMDVDAGDTFKIEKGFQGSVSCDDEQYILKQKDAFSGYIEILEGEDTLFLEPGRYRFHTDGITIEQL